MVCPHCATENASAFGFCRSCGKPLSTVDSVVPPPPPPAGAATAAGTAAAAAPALTAAPPERKPMSIVGMLAIAAVVGIIVFLGIMLPVEGDNQAQVEGFRVGRTLAGLVFPGLLAYVIAGRKRARKPNQFALLFCLFGLILNGANAMSSLSGGGIS